MYNDTLNFWFHDTDPKFWFTSDEGFDEQIRERFQKTLLQAAAGKLYTWRTTPEGRLAEIIVLDQFSRNVYRNTPQAFAQDATALVLAQEAVAAGALEALSPMHSRF